MQKLVISIIIVLGLISISLLSIPRFHFPPSYQTAALEQESPEKAIPGIFNTTSSPESSISTQPQQTAHPSKIPDGSITTSKLADGAVTNSKLAANAVTSDKINDGGINTADIANGAITSDKMASGAVKPIMTERSAPGPTRVSSSNPTDISTAPCNSDEVVTGGGYERDQGANIVKESASGNTWIVKATASGTGLFQAFAECLKLVP